MRSTIALAGLACATSGLTACATGRLPAPPAPVATREFSTTAWLHGKPLVLHLTAPAPATSPAESAAPVALVLYASGDGGWFGTAVQMFRALAAEGQPAVGLSSRAFLKIERPGQARLSPEQLRLDYRVILDRAREALALPPATPAILTGWSRGAAFAVLAAAARQTPPPAGVIAIGLADGENLAIDGPEDETDDETDPGRDSTPRASEPFAPYETLAHGVDIPAAVVQATGDRYLPARQARALFGPDGVRRRFFEVPGRNHRFDGAGRELVGALSQALQWIVGGLAPKPRIAAAALAIGLAAAAPAQAQATDTVTVRGHALTVRTYGTRGGQPVIVTSGDGGWIHLGPYVADSLARRGYFVVGVDARAYLSSFTSGYTTLRPEDEPGDYRVFAEFAGRGSTRKPVLVGVSEGAGLSLLAATDPRTREAIAGVLGLGLPDLNELGWHWRDALIYLTHGTPNEPLFSAARLAPRVAPLPLAAIHSTHDEFVPLADAQKIVAAAGEPKRLWIVDAADHRFSGALPEFDQRLVEALAWIANPHAPAP
ncbi:MAG: AcvB/VirJ family lysyl-phosphatidylglycerol hydrolase [Vicinamibacteraceae bacterium]